MVNRHYLDHAATTEIRPEVLEAYLEAAKVRGNPSSQHTSGRLARAILDDAMAEIAKLLSVPRSWLIMTSGGTEADNLALRGIESKVLALATDHPAVVDTAKALNGDLIKVKNDGLIDFAALEEQLSLGKSSEPIGLLSAALVNNETGIIQDLKALAKLGREYGAVVHSDAVQATGHVELPDFEEIPLVSLTAHKIAGPVGVGLLVANPRIKLQPFGTGGGQQRGIRSGTLDAANAAAFAVALKMALQDQALNGHYIKLAEKLKAGIKAIDENAFFTAENSPHSPHILHVCFKGADQDSILFMLDQHGIDSSAGSACHSGITQDSHVLTAMGISEELKRGAIRFSFGWSSTEADVESLLKVLPEVLKKSREMAQLIHTR